MRMDLILFRAWPGSAAGVEGRRMAFFVNSLRLCGEAVISPNSIIYEKPPQRHKVTKMHKERDQIFLTT